MLNASGERQNHLLQKTCFQGYTIIGQELMENRKFFLKVLGIHQNTSIDCTACEADQNILSNSRNSLHCVPLREGKPKGSSRSVHKLSSMLYVKYPVRQEKMPTQICKKAGLSIRE